MFMKFFVGRNLSFKVSIVIVLDENNKVQVICQLFRFESY